MEETTAQLRKLLQSASWDAEDRVWLKAYLEGKDYTALETIAKEDYESDLRSLTALLDERASQRILDRLHEQIALSSRPKRNRLWPWIGTAAAVAAIVFGVWFFSDQEMASLPRTDERAQHDIEPGKHGATLTLDNGEVIQLSGAKKGVIIANGKISYSSSVVNPSLRGGTTKQSSDEIATLARNDGKGNDEMQKLTASTAKGQTYEFTLPDGTHVFLNADSKISFPSQFSGKERKILLEGEAYFAVVHNEKQPFRVESKGPDGQGQVVEDIGTEFNINAYRDEAAVKTTLVEGSASVSSFPSTSSLRASRSNLDDGKGGGHVITLKPSQQATMQNGSLSVKEVNVNAAIGWKNGKFVLKNEELRSVLRKVARWYDVSIVYETQRYDQTTFSGTVSRFDNVSTVLEMLKTTGKINYTIRGRTITIK